MNTLADWGAPASAPAYDRLPGPPAPGDREMGKMGIGYFDEAYRTGDRTYDDPTRSPYYPLFRGLVERLKRAGAANVLEVGCGSGVLAEMLIRAGLAYRGFDLSAVGVEKARCRNPGADIWVANAADPRCYAGQFDAIVCCEVLEHIEEDLDVIALWPKGSLCVCSVPNFDHEDHVRFFRTKSEILQRFEDALEMQSIDRFVKSPSAGLTWSGYFRRIRWARENPKTLLGILGLNRFNWYAGWFAFVARRR